MKELQLILAWVSIGAQIAERGAEAIARIKAALAAEGIDPAELAKLEGLYLTRIAQAKQDAGAQ